MFPNVAANPKHIDSQITELKKGCITLNVYLMKQIQSFTTTKKSAKDKNTSSVKEVQIMGSQIYFSEEEKRMIDILIDTYYAAVDVEDEAEVLANIHRKVLK